MRKPIDPADVFIKEIKTLITNLLITNKNYNGTYYMDNNNRYEFHRLLTDTKERANFILNRIDELDHLVRDL